MAQVQRTRQGRLAEVSWGEFVERVPPSIDTSEAKPAASDAGQERRRKDKKLAEVIRNEFVNR